LRAVAGVATACPAPRQTRRRNSGTAMACSNDSGFAARSGTSRAWPYHAAVALKSWPSSVNLPSLI
jgi:hypothetical protein